MVLHFFLFPIHAQPSKTKLSTLCKLRPAQRGQSKTALATPSPARSEQDCLKVRPAQWEQI